MADPMAMKTRLCGCKTSPNDHPTATMLDSYYNLFVLIYCVWLMLSIMAKHLHIGIFCPNDIDPEVL